MTENVDPNIRTALYEARPAVETMREYRHSQINRRRIIGQCLQVWPKRDSLG
jgi:hypothetical protein